MRLVDQWRRLSASLPEDWGDARLLLRVEDEGRAERAAALLVPLLPGRRGKEIRFVCARRAGPSEDAVRRALARLDAERITGDIELVSVTPVQQPAGISGRAPAAEPEGARRSAPGREPLARQWDDALAALPPDWSDLYVEIELTSTDHLERGALLLGPTNPARVADAIAFRFRCARSFGYGASAGMVQRCFERLDEAGIAGHATILRVLSDSRPVYTQGPVWYVGGRAV